MSQLEEKAAVSLVSLASIHDGQKPRADDTVWGRQDLAITVLGDPAAGTAVGM
jgi:hypothetical protein